MIAFAVGSSTASATAEPARVKVGSGTGIVVAHNTVYRGACTLTAVGRDVAGDLVGLTNAHCFYNSAGEVFHGAQIYFDSAPQGAWAEAVPDETTGPIGTVEYISGGNPATFVSPEAGLDYAVIRFDESKVIPTATVGQLTVTEIGAPPAGGTVVCKQGRFSGLTCGAMIAFPQTPNERVCEATLPPLLLVIGMRLKAPVPAGYFCHTVFTGPSDSGSPVAVGTTLLGHTWVTGSSVSILAIIDDMNARGGVGAGFTLAAA
ncbi:peptidase S1 [Saccharopolyspora thermophila]|uniref:peptidase S1 n=1 Tax=Saccharopolyspora thermophila TaxID=89367 RepID=UPI00166C0539|nr:peptidase S1 [Saccharopolyspora subtropica]